MSARTKRWQGTVVPRTSHDRPGDRPSGYIPCSVGAPSTPRHKSVFSYHDWFIANHPPLTIRPA